MNVADLLHDSPSDDLRRRHARQEHPQEQHPHPQPPPQPSQRPPHHSPRLERPRDQLRERDRPPQDLPHPSHPHVQQPLAYRRSPPPLHPSRPSSPPRHPPAYGGPPAPGADFPAHSSSSSQRHFLPSPSAILSEPPYEVVGGHGPRRVQELPHDRLGPPPPAGHPSSSVQIQPFVVEHRTPSIPPKPHLSHPNHHAHSHPSTPSPMYMAPPPGRSIHASPPHTHHSSHGPGQGSIPLFPTPVGPGVPPSGPPMHAPAGPPPSSTGGLSLRIGDPPPMYGSHGPSPHPHSQPYSHHSHHRDDRHRGRGSSTSSNAPPVPAGVLSSTASPVMASLQRPAPYDERDRDRERELREMGRAALERDRERAERIERERVERDGGPSMVPRPRGHPGAPGPGLGAGPGSSLTSMPSTPISPGPGRPLGHFFPSRSTAIPADRRERDRERGMEREERERRSSVSVAAVSPLESPEVARRERDLREKELRERELREREIMEKEKARQERQAAMKDRERQERHAQRERELQAREREQMQLQQMERERERERELRDQEMRERMRQREMLEREQREREREQAERDGYRRHMHEIMGVSGGGLGLGAGPSMAEAEEREREREWVKQQKRIQQQQQQQQQQGLGHPDMRPSSQGQPSLPPPHEHQHRPPSGSGRMGPPGSQGAPQVWSRILPPQMGPTHEDERMMMEREQAERRRVDEMPPREVSWDAREAKAEREPRQSGRGGKGRTTTKEREERAKAAVAEGGERAEPQRRQRVSAREKEQRERERRAEMEQQEREQHREQHEREQRELERREREREREQREFRMREHEFAWRQEAELMEQERMQRAMHEDALRAGRAREVQGATHGQQLLHHPHSAAGTPFGPEVPQAHPKLLSGKSGQMGTPSLAQDLPPQYQHERERDFRHPPKGGPAQIQMGIPPHSHAQHHPHLPGPHPHQIGGPPQFRQHQDMYGPGPISRRPSPPPFHPQSAPAHQAATMLRRSGSPPAPLVLAIKHLGTFVYPRTPFPFLDFPPSLTESGTPADPLDIRATIFLPSRFLPLTRPARPRIWGGALIPAVPPLSGTQRQMCIQFSGAHPQYGRPWPEEVREGRRVYTDDSDLFLCALHAGWVSWSQARKARRESRDLKIEVKLTREARFVGGFGNVLRRERGEPVEDLGAEDDGRELLSSGWGNGHDGAGVEILRAEFVLPGTAHSFGVRNRSQRMLEYAERRAALGCGSRSSRKRRRLLNGSFADGESTVQLAVEQEDEELCDTRVMVFGTDSSWPEIGFKYHPDALSAILFPQASPEGRPPKRRKLATIADNATSATPPLDESSDDELVLQQRAVVVETLWESFLISQRGQIPSSELENDKENASDAAPSGSGRRYVIALLTNAGGTMGRLSKSTQQQPKDVETADGTRKPVPAADEPPEASGMRGDVNGLTQPGSGADESPQEKGTPAVPASDTQDLASDADAKMTTSTSKDCETPAQLPESIARAPSSSDESTDEGSGPIQILHRDLGEENFEFVPDGINVVSGEVVNGMRKGWKLEARQWKWVQVGVSS